MNSKQRVAAAITRRPVDRTPIGLYAVDHDTVSAVLGRPTFVRNRVGTWLAYHQGRRDEVVAGWKEDLVEFYRKLDCLDIITCRDAQLVPPKGYHPEAKQITEDKWEDPAGRVYQLVEDIDEVICIYDSTKDESREYAVEEFQTPVEMSQPDESIFEVLDAVINEFGEERYIAGVSGGTLPLTPVGGLEYGLMLYALQPEVVLAATKRNVETQNAQDAWMIRPGTDGVVMDMDMGGTNAPLISPAMFREMVMPYMTQRIAHVKQFCPQVIHHNCGNTILLMDMLIETGIDCYQSLQTTAGMDLAILRPRFGDRLSFWGGVPLEILIDGSVEQTRKAVRKAIADTDGEGLILGPSQSVAMKTKYDNFMAMLDEVTK